jgi:hypothetical protein
MLKKLLYRHFTKSFLPLCALLTISACTDISEEVDGMVKDGDLKDAVEWMEKEIAGDPENPLYHALAAEVKTRLCVEEKCTETQPEKLKEIANHLGFVTKPVVTEGDKPRNVYANLLEISKGFKNDPNHPKPIIAFLDTIPAHIPQQNFAKMLMDMSTESIGNFEVPATLSLLQKVKDIAPASDYAIYIPLIHGMISNDDEAIPSAMEIAQQPDGKMTPEIAYMIPYAFFFQEVEKDSANGAFNFVKDFNKNFKELHLSKTNHMTAKASVSQSLREMANNKKFVAMAIKHINRMTPVEAEPEKAAEQNSEKGEKAVQATTALETPTAKEEMSLTEENRRELFKLYLFKTSLTFNPDQQKVWDEFLQPAMNYVDSTGFVDLLFSGIDQNKIPKDAIEPYNDKLFKIIESRFKSGENTISLLQKVIIPLTNNKDIVGKVDDIVNKGIKKAIKESDHKRLVDYASFKPSIAKPYRQEIVGVIVKALDNLWNTDEFEDMSRLAGFLKNSMGIDFNLDSLLVKKFQEFIVNAKIHEELSADTPDMLLQKQKEVQLDLGKKYAFLKEHFKATPETMDSQLKTLVLNAKGAYGTPVAFFRLYHLFDNVAFPLEERNEFLVGAIKDSLEKNEEITAPEMVKVGYQLVKNHPDIPLIFIVSETLRRINSLEESREVWKTANNEFKEKLKNVKPQFTTLMEAIQLFDSNKKTQAFELFSVLSDEKYLETAGGYLTKLRKIIGDHKGIFVIDGDTSERMHAVLIVVEPLSDPKQVTSLLDVKVKIVNAIGSVMIKSDTELTEDYGRTFSYTFNGQVNPDLQILPITEEQRAGAQLPQSFERTFGDIVGIKFDQDEKTGDAIIMAINTAGTTYPFHRITSDIRTPLFPQGTFGITKQISGKNKNTDHVMPVGTIINIKTDEKRPIQPIHEGKKLSIVYPVTGEVLHPSSPIPRPFSGFYGIDTHTINFEYDYPLSKGSKGTLQAITTCQALDNTILCASHNKHWSRLKFSHIVKGYKAESDESEEEPRIVPSEESADGLLEPPEALQQ